MAKSKAEAKPKTQAKPKAEAKPKPTAKLNDKSIDKTSRPIVIDGTDHIAGRLLSLIHISEPTRPY